MQECSIIFFSINGIREVIFPHFLAFDRVSAPYQTFYFFLIETKEIVSGWSLNNASFSIEQNYWIMNFHTKYIIVLTILVSEINTSAEIKYIYKIAWYLNFKSKPVYNYLVREVN